jgi:hypothetical protein
MQCGFELQIGPASKGKHCRVLFDIGAIKVKKTGQNVNIQIIQFYSLKYLDRSSDPSKMHASWSSWSRSQRRCESNWTCIPWNATSHYVHRAKKHRVAFCKHTALDIGCHSIHGLLTVPLFCILVVASGCSAPSSKESHCLLATFLPSSAPRILSFHLFCL